MREAVGEGKPFFAMVNFIDPHRPFTGHIADIPAAPLGPDDIEPFGFLGLDTPAVREEVAGYYNCVGRFDVGLGLLLEELRQAGQSENTLVLVVGDQGPPFARSTTTCYEVGLRIPFIVSWPGRVQAGMVREELISTVDILPTVCAAAGVATPSGLPGKSLLGLARGKSVPWREAVGAEFTAHAPAHYFPRRSMRDGRYHLIVNLLTDRPNPVTSVDGGSEWAASQDASLDGSAIRKVYDRYHEPPAVELYDLQSDPYEFNNLAGQEQYKDIEERLMGQLRQWQRQTDDPLADAANLAALTAYYDGLPRRRK